MSGSELVPRYTRTGLENARTKGQPAGWPRNVHVAFGVLLVVGLIFPAVLLAVGAAVVLSRLLNR